MITEPTVVVLGAGVSNDLGLPLGTELQARVTSAFTDTGTALSPYYTAAIKNLLGDRQSTSDNLIHKAKAHCRALKHAASIDNYLDQVRSEVDFVNAAKMMIGYQIANGENNCSIAGIDRPADIVDAAVQSDYFLNDFLNLVVRGHQIENIEASLRNITFVVFNYDRCLERVLFAWLSLRFGNNATDLYRAIRIIHVYGSLGNYPDEETNFFRKDSAGPMLNPHLEMPKFAGRIKIFTEQEESNLAHDIATAVRSSTCLIFLGFGFEEQNMRFFRCKDSYSKHVFATTMGKGKANEAAIEESLIELVNLEANVHMVSGKAKALFSTFHHAIGRAIGSTPRIYP
ncbi:MAG: hypothetical protein IH625_06125 [Rhodobacteraceae bacterium]|nr:hypothetical protein [Paracoccaceae bacterium]